MSQPKEIKSTTPEQPQLFGSTLGAILRDVRGVAENWQEAAGKYRNLGLITPHSLIHAMRRTRENIDKAFEMLAFLEGEQFTALSPLLQRERVYEVSRTDSRILGKKLAQLYKEFQDQPPTESGAWRKYVEAFDAFRAHYSRNYGLELSAPFPAVFETFHIELPSLIKIESFNWDRTEPETAQKNTQLQVDLAKAIGVLQPREGWVDFLDRETIHTVEFKNWKEFHRIEVEEPYLIPGIQSGYDAKNVFYKGIPFYYSASTKYPGVRSHIRFEARKEKWFEPLGNKSLNTGDSTVGIELVIPTELFFSA